MSSNETSDEHDSVLALFCRRKLYYSTIHFIAARRNELLRDVPIDQLIALAFFSSPSDLKRFGAIPSLRSAVLKKYLSQNCDLFHDWQLFCKTVKKSERSEYLIEGAIHFASYDISQPRRQEWRSLGCELLRLLQDSQYPAPDTAAVQFNSISTSVDADSRFIAEMPEAYLLRNVLGGFLYVGMRLSHKRKGENNKRLTSAVRLHSAAVSGDDFRLEVFVNAVTRSAIVQSNGDPDLTGDMLGPYLAPAMDGSIWRQEEKRGGIVDASKALDTLPTETTDWRVLIWLQFSTGIELLNRLFPV